MRESVTEMKEVVVRAITDKSNTDRNFATVSTLPFNAEMTRRFATAAATTRAAWPANFAGVVSNNDARNDIVIRGQFPRRPVVAPRRRGYPQSEPFWQYGQHGRAG